MREDASRNTTMMAGAVAAGAALMYFLDPSRGRRRRALARDKLSHLVRGVETAADATRADTRNRARGLLAEARSRLRADEPSDEVLVDRIRATMGRVVSHPGSVIVTAHEGHVVLSGPVLAGEEDALLECVRGVRGVEEVESHLEPHDEPGNVPGLQGGKARGGERGELLQRHWSPATRLATGAAGGGLVAYGATKRGAVGTALALGGLGLLVRSGANVELRRLVRFGRGQSIELQRTITIAAPVEMVFGFFSDFEHFPEFMSHVRRVQDVGDGRTHWVVDGPAGRAVEWDAIVTRAVPNEVIEWRSVEGSEVENSGSVRFEGAPEGGTRVTVRMEYVPPAGKAGKAVSSMLGANPAKEMEEDLGRLKTTIESGVAPRDASAAAPM